MITFLTVLHVANCVLLAIIVLLQHGKGADIGATFGGSSQTVFGARGAATFLSKLTAGSAVVFMLTSITLAALSASESSKSVFAAKKQAAQSPKAPSPVPSGIATAIPTASPPAPAKTATPTK